MAEAAIGHNSAGRVRCIFRAHGDRGYTKLRNTFLQDRNISDETRGLVARLLSLPDDWEVTVQSIIASGKAGRDKVYRMIREAEQFGYIQPEQGRKDAGRFDRQLYLVSDDPEALIERAASELLQLEDAQTPGAEDPQPEKPEPAKTAEIKPLTEKPETGTQPLAGLPLTEKPEAVKAVDHQGFSPLTGLPLTAEPLTAEPLTEKPDAYKRNIGKNINTPPYSPPTDVEGEATPTAKPKRQRSQIPDQYPYDFEEFWKVYPRREGKADAFRKWQRLTMPQKRRAYAALKTQLHTLKARMNDRRGNFCPLPATWINQGRFDDEPADRPANTSPPPQPQSWQDEEAERLRKFNEFMEKSDA